MAESNAYDLAGSPPKMGKPAMVELIGRKKRGGELSAEELNWLCREYVGGRIPDYQVAAWLMAVCWRSMTERETLALTRALVASGASLDWRHLPRPPVDKHSTGGVGDKTSLVLVPLVAAAGLPCVKMSGRGLGHTGGTLDKLESIPGLRVELSLEQVQAQVTRIGCAIVGQSPQLVPADRLLYALRDVTATVDCLPLIAASVMSKKLAAGASSIVLDVKHGSGGLIETIEQARELALRMVEIGRGAGRRVRAVLSSMSEPLGRAIGNALEVREAIETVQGAGPADLWQLTLELGSQLLLMSGEVQGASEAAERLEEARASGAAARKLAALIEAQGGDPRVVEEPDRLPAAPVVLPLEAPAEWSGWLGPLDARTAADAALQLGAGRRAKEDEIDPAVGIRLLKKTGEVIRGGEPLLEIHARSTAAAVAAADMLRHGLRLTDRPITPAPVEHEVMDVDPR
jgi:pyrimidine-nucleoside phosphorylase